MYLRFDVGVPAYPATAKNRNDPVVGFRGLEAAGSASVLFVRLVRGNARPQVEDGFLRPGVRKKSARYRQLAIPLIPHNCP